MKEFFLQVQNNANSSSQTPYLTYSIANKNYHKQKSKQILKLISPKYLKDNIKIDKFGTFYESS